MIGYDELNLETEDKVPGEHSETGKNRSEGPGLLAKPSKSLGRRSDVRRVGVALSQNACQSTTRTGKPCGSWAQSDSPFCFVHDPESREKATQARIKAGQSAGQSKRLRSQLPRLKTLEDLQGFVATIITQTHQGLLSADTSRALAYACSLQKSLISDQDLQSRIDSLEEVLKNSGRPSARQFPSARQRLLQ